MTFKSLGSPDEGCGAADLRSTVDTVEAGTTKSIWVAAANGSAAETTSACQPRHNKTPDEILADVATRLALSSFRPDSRPDCSHQDKQMKKAMEEEEEEDAGTASDSVESREVNSGGCCLQMAPLSGKGVVVQEPPAGLAPAACTSREEGNKDEEEMVPVGTNQRGLENGIHLLSEVQMQDDKSGESDLFESAGDPLKSSSTESEPSFTTRSTLDTIPEEFPSTSRQEDSPQEEVGAGEVETSSGKYFVSALKHQPTNRPVKMFVNRIPKDMRNEELRRHFEAYGVVLECNIIRDASGPKGCAFIKYASIDDAQKAILHLHGKCVLSPAAGPMQVKYANGEIERLGLSKDVQPGGECVKVFVGCLPRQCSNEMLHDLFSRYGRVDEVHLLKDADGKKSKCSAFITYPQRGMAERAIASLDKVHVMEMGKRPMEVRLAESKSSMNQSRRNSKNGKLEQVPRNDVKKSYRPASAPRESPEQSFDGKSLPSTPPRGRKGRAGSRVTTALRGGSGPTERCSVSSNSRKVAVDLTARGEKSGSLDSSGIKTGRFESASNRRGTNQPSSTMSQVLSMPERGFKGPDQPFSELYGVACPQEYLSSTIVSFVPPTYEDCKSMRPLDPQSSLRVTAHQVTELNETAHDQVLTERVSSRCVGDAMSGSLTQPCKVHEIGPPTDTTIPFSTTAEPGNLTTLQWIGDTRCAADFFQGNEAAYFAATSLVRARESLPLVPSAASHAPPPASVVSSSLASRTSSVGQCWRSSSLETEPSKPLQKGEQETRVDNPMTRTTTPATAHEPLSLASSLPGPSPMLALPRGACGPASFCLLPMSSLSPIPMTPLALMYPSLGDRGQRPEFCLTPPPTGLFSEETIVARDGVQRGKSDSSTLQSPHPESGRKTSGAQAGVPAERSPSSQRVNVRSDSRNDDTSSRVIADDENAALEVSLHKANETILHLSSQQLGRGQMSEISGALPCSCGACALLPEVQQRALLPFAGGRGLAFPWSDFTWMGSGMQRPDVQFLGAPPPSFLSPYISPQQSNDDASMPVLPTTGSLGPCGVFVPGVYSYLGSSASTSTV